MVMTAGCHDARTEEREMDGGTKKECQERGEKERERGGGGSGQRQQRNVKSPLGLDVVGPLA